MPSKQGKFEGRLWPVPHSPPRARRPRIWPWLLLALGGAACSTLAQPSEEEGKSPEQDGPGSTQKVDAYRPQPSKYADAPDRPLHLDAPEGATVVRIPVEGTIDLGLSAFIQRALKDLDSDVALVLLDVNTLGGRVDAAIQIRDALLSSKVKTAAFVHPRAISAGALISLACDYIAVSPGATIGAATPIQLGQGGAQPVEEKMVSYFRAEMRTTAESKGRRGDVAEAMVDSSVEIEGLSQAGKLVTLDTESALEWKIADVEAASVGDLLAKLGLKNAVLDDLEENWAEDLVRFLTDPVVSGLLMSLGTLGILMELYSPGLGVPGALGALCLVLFFAGHLIVNLAGIEELLLFTVGLALLAAEIFVIPGFGVAGILGSLFIFASLVLTMVGLPIGVAFSTGAWLGPLKTVLWALTMTMLGSVIAIRYLPRTTAGRRLVLSTSTDKASGFVSSNLDAALIGKGGVAHSDLRPSGIATIEGKRLDVVSQGEYVARGSRVRIIEIEGGRVVVVADESETES